MFCQFTIIVSCRSNYWNTNFFICFIKLWGFPSTRKYTFLFHFNSKWVLELMLFLMISNCLNFYRNSYFLIFFPIVATTTVFQVRLDFYLTLKPWWVWEVRGGDKFEPPPCGFSKNISSKERVKPWFFVTFKLLILS